MRNASGFSLFSFPSRGDWIRTSGPLFPKQMRYQAAPHPVELQSLSNKVRVGKGVMGRNGSSAAPPPCLAEGGRKLRQRFRSVRDAVFLCVRRSEERRVGKECRERG